MHEIMPMKDRRPSKVLLYQSFGFLAIIGVCMLDELVGLSSLILGDQPFLSNFRESTLKAVLIFGVWLLVAGSTRRILEHLRYLETFMKVCAWCRRIEHKGRWMPLEEYFQQGFDTPTSHGICLDCLEKTKAALERDKHEAACQSPTPVEAPHL